MSVLGTGSSSHYKPILIKSKPQQYTNDGSQRTEAVSDEHTLIWWQGQEQARQWLELPMPCSLWAAEKPLIGYLW